MRSTATASAVCMMLAVRLAFGRDAEPPAAHAGARASDLPTVWDVEKNVNVRWTADLPDISLAAPVAVGDRVLVTAEPETLLCFDGLSGRLLWRKEVTVLGEYPDEVRTRARDALRKVVDYWKSGKVILGPFCWPKDFTWEPMAHKEEIEFLRKTCKIDVPGIYLGGRGYACAPPVSDGTNVWARFGTGSIGCYDLATGAKVWLRRLPPPPLHFPGRTNVFGLADTAEWSAGAPWPHILGLRSPMVAALSAPMALLNGRIVLVEQLKDGARLVGLDGRTGDRNWTSEVFQPEPNCIGGGPAIVTVEGKPFIATCSGEIVDPASGKILLSNLGVTLFGNQVHVEPNAIVLEAARIRLGMKDGVLIALDPPQRGTDGKTADMWPHTYGHTHNDYGTDLPVGRYGYTITTRGLTNMDGLRIHDLLLRQVAVEAIPLIPNPKSGHWLSEWRFRVRARTPILADGMLYCPLSAGNLAVLRPGLEPRLLAMNRLPDEITAPCAAAPGRIYARTAEKLYCFGATGEEFQRGWHHTARGDDGQGSFRHASAPVPAVKSHNLRWNVEDPGGAAVVSWDMLLQGAGTGALVCRNAADGRERWRLPAVAGDGHSDLAVRSGRAFFLAAGRLRGIAAHDGTRVWDVPAESARTLLLSGNAVLAAGTDLVAFAQDDGRAIWRAEGIGNRPPVRVTAQGRGFVVLQDGRVLRESDGSEAAPKLGAEPLWGGDGRLIARRAPAKICGLLFYRNGTGVDVVTAWERDCAAPADQAILCDGRVYACIGAKLLVFDPHTGRELGSCDLPAAPTGSMLAAAEHLWLPGAGGPDATVVATLDPAPKIAWTYRARGGAHPPVFLPDGCGIRAGGRLFALLGKRLSPPEPVEVVEIPDSERPPDLGRFQNDDMPRNWLFAGPLPGADADRDHLAGIGGRTNVAIRDGLAFAVEGKEFAFRPLAATSLWVNAASGMGKKPVIELTGIHGVTNSTGYYATAIDNDLPRLVRLRTRSGGCDAGSRVFMDGIRMDKEKPIRLGVGRHRLLVIGTLGGLRKPWDKVWMAPRLWDDTFAVQALLRRHDEAAAAWKRHQREDGGKPLVCLPPEDTP